MSDRAVDETAAPSIRAYLLTGRPGTGKTSLVREALAGTGVSAGGFYTEEVREGGARLGFRLVTLDGRRVVLAHVDFTKRFRVGKYGVDVAVMEQVGVPALSQASRERGLVVVDEIGRMELLSEDFRRAVTVLLEGGTRVLGTIMLQSDPFADAVKRRPGVRLVTLTRESYRQTLEDVCRWLKG